MSSIVQPYIENLKSIENKIPDLAKQALKENYSEIVMLVKAEQLGKGKNSMGLPLAWSDGKYSGDGFYSDATDKIADNSINSALGRSTKKPKIAGEPYNFSWTGATLDGMAMKDTGVDTFEIFTTDSKKSYLEGIYGEIFKLTEKHNTYVNEQIILPYLYRYILNNFMKV